MGGRFQREGASVYTRLIHVDVWQKPTQHCKAIILQLKSKKKKKKLNQSINQNRNLHRFRLFAG